MRVTALRIDGSKSPRQFGVGDLDPFWDRFRTLDVERGEIHIENSDRRIVLDLDGNAKTKDKLPVVWDTFRENGIG